MTKSLAPQAAGAVEALRALERALTEARVHWDDSTRQAFDERHIELVLASGQTIAGDLGELARELDRAQRELGD